MSFFKIDELCLVGKCVDHSFRIYMGCYLQCCITKKLRPVNQNSSKVHFLHIQRAREGLKPQQHKTSMKYLITAILVSSAIRLLRNPTPAYQFETKMFFRTQFFRTQMFFSRWPIRCNLVIFRCILAILSSPPPLGVFL